MTEADKKMEEIGYEKLFDTEYGITYTSDDRATYNIVFVKRVKGVYKTDTQGLMGYPITMEELEVINEKCKELGWIK